MENLEVKMDNGNGENQIPDAAIPAEAGTATSDEGANARGVEAPTPAREPSVEDAGAANGRPREGHDPPLQRESDADRPREGEMDAYFRTHIQSLEQQGEAMRQVFPGFDLRRELRHPLFVRLTAPDVGLSVEDAYYTLHRHAIQAAAMEATAQRTARQITSAIRSGMRPVEHGMSGQAPSVAACDYRSMSPEQRKALKDRIRSGEKIYP